MREAEVVSALVPLERQRGQVGVQIVNGAYGAPSSGTGAAMGECCFDKQGNVVGLVLPAPRERRKPGGAHARVVRTHEILHARHTNNAKLKRCKFQPLVENAFEDARVHYKYWPQDVGTDMNRSLNRDCLAVALLDLHEIVTHPPTKFNWNSSILTLVRSMAILRGLGIEFPKKLLQRLKAIYGEHILNRLWRAVEAASRADVVKKMKEVMADIESCCIPEPADPERPKRLRPGGRPGRKVDVEMEVYDPPKTAPCVPMKCRKIVLRPYGGRINYGRLPQFVTSFDTSKLFLHRPTMEGFKGTIVIDASGSMGVSDVRLARLCRRLPGALVAYYSDWCEPEYGKTAGTLVVYARGGRRISDAEGAPKHGGGNDVDAAGIEWLLNQPGPHVLVTDEGFCGGWEGQSMRARALLRANPEVRVIPSIAEAWKQLLGVEEVAD